MIIKAGKINKARGNITLTIGKEDVNKHNLQEGDFIILTPEEYDDLKSSSEIEVSTLEVIPDDEAVIKLEYDLKEAKGSDTRHLNLVVLKNKDGIKDYVIPVDYLPAYNYFKEVPARQDNLSKKLLTKDKAAISDEKVLKI